MARMQINGIDEYALKLSRLGRDSVEISKNVVMAGANPLADTIRSELEKNLEGSKNTTGDLLSSLGIAPPSIDRKGNTNTKIGFQGYDRKGVPNALKARAMESGTSTQRKKPFMRKALNKSKQKVQEEMGKELDRQIRIYAL